MQLDLDIHEVREIRWGNTTHLSAGTLHVNRDDLADLLCHSDSRLSRVEMELAQPGESCRIGPVFDVVEPRTKLAPEGIDFPGAIGPLHPVGYGRTRVLRGMAVTVLNAMERPRRRPNIIDLSGVVPPGWRLEELGVYARLNHLVLIARAVDGLTRDETANVYRMAVLRAAVYLAQRASGKPEAQERYCLGLPAPDAPRIAYVYQIHSHQRPTVPGEPILYGDNARHLLPTILFPTEILDGAVLPGYGERETYKIQNHPVILELLRRHGSELNFVGVVAVVAHQTAAERERTVVVAGNIVRYILRADGAVFTKSGGGAPHVDMAELAHCCEQKGIKTSLIAWQLSSMESPDEGSALFNYPDLNAIVNVGSNGFQFHLPRVNRLISPRSGGEAADALRGPLTVTATALSGVLDQLGGGNWTTSLY